MTVAFVLSGGASLGASQAGMLHALYEHGVRPDLLVGTSVGAVNAGFVASREPSEATAGELESLWRGLSRAQVFPANPLTAGLGLLGLRDHSVPAGPLRRLLRRHLEFDRLEEAAIPIHVVATDMLSGQEMRLSSGPAVDAVLASAAIPGVFPAVAWESGLLVDGAVTNNTPISHAVELGADRIVVLQAMGTDRLPRVPRGVLGAGVAAIARAVGRRFDEDILRYADLIDLLIVPPAAVTGILPTDFGHADDLIAAGRAAACATLRRRVRRPRMAPGIARAA